MLKANKNDEALPLVKGFPETGVQGFAKYDSAKKEVQFFFEAQLPIKYTDPKDNKVKQIADYKLDLILLVGGLKENGKERELIQIPLNESVKADEQKDFNPPKLTHIQKVDNVIYLAFDKDIDKGKFGALVLKSSNGHLTKENNKFSPIDSKDIKVEFLSFEDNSTKNIVKVSLNNAKDEAKLSQFNLRLADRTYVFDFTKNDKLKDRLVFNSKVQNN